LSFLHAVLLSLTSSLAPPIFVDPTIYGGVLSLMYWNILFSSFINSILCSNLSATLCLQSKVAVLPSVTYCGAINCTFMWSASVASGNREITVRIYYRVILEAETSWTLSTTSNMNDINSRGATKGQFYDKARSRITKKEFK